MSNMTNYEILETALISKITLDLMKHTAIIHYTGIFTANIFNGAYQNLRLLYRETHSFFFFLE